MKIINANCLEAMKDLSGIDAIGIDLDEQWCETARRRLAGKEDENAA
jgi:hypothetical protein